MDMVEEIRHDGELMAIILRRGFDEPGVHFVTPGEFSQQLAFMHHPAGRIISPHVHNPVHRDVYYTLEVLFIRRGRLRIDFYSSEKAYLKSEIIDEGDTILLATGGHGFEALEELEMIEVKQGPYAGDQDKTRFEGISKHEVTLKKMKD